MFVLSRQKFSANFSELAVVYYLEEVPNSIPNWLSGANGSAAAGTEPTSGVFSKLPHLLRSLCLF